MTTEELDDVERGILYLLQQNARDATTTDIADRIGVSAGTIRNRIDSLEERGILKGYVPDVDYEKAGFELHILFTCTAPQSTDEYVEEILEQRGVVAVRKLLAGEENLHVETTGTSTDDISRIARDLQDVGLEVVRSDVLEGTFVQPFNHFGKEIADGEE